MSVVEFTGEEVEFIAHLVDAYTVEYPLTDREDILTTGLFEKFGKGDMETAIMRSIERPR